MDILIYEDLMKDKITMNEFYNEPEIYLVGSIEELEQIEAERRFNEIDPMQDHDLNQKVDSDYHNTYYHGNGKYGTRTIRMSNKEWHKLNK